MTSKQIAALTIALLLGGCGYSSADNELTGQVKKIAHRTPLLCFDRFDADISLGIMRNGVGSMSTQDMWMTVPDAKNVDLLKSAADSGKLVKIRYDVYRLTFCINDAVVRSVEVLP